MSVSTAALRTDARGWSVTSGLEAVDTLPQLLEAVRSDGAESGREGSDMRFDLANAFMQLQPQPSTDSLGGGSSYGALAHQCEIDDDEFARRASKVFEDDDTGEMTPTTSFEVRAVSAPAVPQVGVGMPARFLEEKAVAQHCSRITANLNQTSHRRLVQFSVQPSELPGWQPVQLFIGQLPFNFNQIGLAQVLNALLSRAGAAPILSVMRGRPTCAFITVEARGAAVLLDYNKRLLSDVDGVWCADLGRGEALQEINTLSELRQRRQLAGSPDKPLVIEPVRGNNGASHDGGPIPYHRGPTTATDSVLHRGPSPGFQVVAAEGSDPQTDSVARHGRLVQLGFVYHPLASSAAQTRSFGSTPVVTQLSHAEGPKLTLHVAHWPPNPSPAFVSEVLETLVSMSTPAAEGPHPTHSVVVRIRQGSQPTTLFVEVPHAHGDALRAFSGRVWPESNLQGIWVGPVGCDPARGATGARPLSIDGASPLLGDVFAKEDLSEGLRSAESEELSAAGCKYISVSLGAFPTQPPALSRQQGKVRQVFLGMLPSAFNERALCEGIHAVLGTPELVITRCQIGSKPTCAFLTLLHEHGETLLSYAKRILCGREGMWVAPLGNARAELALSAASERRLQAPARGVPSHLMVIEPVLGANRGQMSGEAHPHRRQNPEPSLPFAPYGFPTGPMWYPSMPQFSSVTLGVPPMQSTAIATAAAPAPTKSCSVSVPRGRLDTATGVWIPAESVAASATGAGPLPPRATDSTLAPPSGGSGGTCCSGCGLPHVPGLVKLGEICTLCRVKLPPSSFAKRCKTANCTASEIICTRCLAQAHE